METQLFPPWLSSGAGLAMAALLLAVLAIWLVRRAAPYRARKFLFTRAEWAFLVQLRRAVEPDLMVMGKVRIADVLAVSRRKPRSSAWWRAFSRISSKHLDYVLCNPSNGAIRCAIELDDSSHARPDRIRRDRFVNRACEAAGLPLLRVRQQRSYQIEAIRARVSECLAPEERGGIK